MVTAPSRTSNGDGPTTRTTSRSATPTCCAGTPSGPGTWQQERSTSRWRQETTTLLAALATQWDNTVARRTYLTGGQGSHHQDEAFGDDWVLPPDRAYSETCASVASIMFSWRLMLATGHAKYADLIERTLFNVIATSPDATGTAFFYTNTLHQRRPGTVPATDEACPRAHSSLRAPWYSVSCCPPNVARTLASLASYIATTDTAGLQIHQFTPAQIRCTLPDGRRIEVDIETAYPAEGTVRVNVANDSDQPWTLTLRVPHWAHGATLRNHPERRGIGGRYRRQPWTGHRHPQVPERRRRGAAPTHGPAAHGSGPTHRRGTRMPGS